MNNIRYAIPVERTSFPDKWHRWDCTREDRGPAKGGVDSGHESAARWHTEGTGLARTDNLAPPSTRMEGRPIPIPPAQRGSTARLKGRID